MATFWLNLDAVEDLSGGIYSLHLFRLGGQISFGRRGGKIQAVNNSNSSIIVIIPGSRLLD
jgi:hypothetical protein